MDIYCVEWDNVTGGVLVVQRNRISNLLGNKLFTLGENKHELFSIINKIKPDIIHLQEIPEMFMQNDVADKLYSTHRNYVIIETSHDSGYNTENKVYIPDKFLMVSKYQMKMYEPLGIPCDVVEYPIENKVRTKTREQALLALGLDPNIRHVINVGLFTPRKNQAEVIEYARMLQNYPIQFHFLGNQADNFKFYWEPLMKNFPSNCKWWNERSDVDAFYEAADLMLFTSRGSDTDHETMPLVIREALGWKTPSMIYNLPVYMNYFDEYDSIEYLETDVQQNVVKIAQKLMNIEIDEKITMNSVNYGISSRWDENEQVIHYSTQHRIDFPIIVSLKEYKSNAVLWSATYDTIEPNVEYWMLPIHKNFHNYSIDPNYMGVKLCIYRKDTGTQIYEMPFVTGFTNIPTVTLSDSIPYRMNYIEFYVDKKYDKWIGKKHNTVVDVGANVGLFTQYMLDSEYANHVVSIECGKKALQDLQRNFKRNPWVTVIPKALYHANTEITFYQADENPLISSLLSPDQLKNHGAGLKGDNAYTVDTITIKELVDTYSEIDLLKIDIEGGEYQIITNTEDSVFDHVHSLMIECHLFEDNYKEQYKLLLDKLKRLGYTVEEYVDNLAEVLVPGASEAIYAYRKDKI